ncbi:sensor domain-containing diguanylate cyclase [Xanthobacter flavus]|uniref:sensor domain-containing diguanylate cyclase n=1 Tax=Xanthobacter flavus TaxID=281 RepID=UPI00372BB4BE
MRRLIAGGYVPLIVGGLVAVIIAAQALTLWRSYQATWQLALRSGENALNTLSSSISRNLSLLDLSLRGAEEAVATSGLSDISPELRQMVLFDRAAGAQFLGSMLVLNRDGSIVYDSGSVPPRVGNFADRDYFTAQMDGSRGTYVSAPFESRLRAGDPSIALSRRISGPGGSFDGVVIAALRIAFFQLLLDNVDLGPRSVIALTRSDGTVILRHPSTDGKGNTGVSVAASPVFQRMMTRPGEPFSDRSVFDGENRYYLHTQIAGFPLLLSVGISTQAAMAEWIESAMTSSAMTLGMCVLLILLVRALRLALMHSQDMEAQLEVLSVTDQLTGVPNRRAFDLAAATEMRRAARNRECLAILIVDIDHFKKVNDRYGHSVGDEVIARIAKQIVRSVRRPGDFVARYGGEEFIVILPATDGAGATFIAERIRSEVASMVPSPAEAALTQVTVSIGAAVAEVEPSSSLATLVNSADRALYEAKGSGRNRIVVDQDGCPAKAADRPPNSEQRAPGR